MAKAKTDQTMPHSAAYRAALAHWPKSAGEKPTELMFSILHAFGLRQGSKHALAMAMYGRDSGATDAQVIAAAHKLTPEVGHQGVLHNYRRQYEASGFFTRDMAQPKGVYKITITPKGQAFIDRKAQKAVASAFTTPAPAAPSKAQRKAAKAVRKAAKAVEAAQVEAVIDTLVAAGAPAPVADTPQA